MTLLKKLTMLLILSSAVLMLIISCNGSNQNTGMKSSGAVAMAESSMAEEMAAGLPDFNSPPVEDKNLKVEGMPEEVVWITSYPKDLSSKNTKKGGTFHTYIDEYPTTFRYTGPESNLGTRELMWPHVGFVGENNETQEITPLAATHWAFGADNQTVYYKLNENMKWSDGVPCTADDWVFAWEVMCSPNLNDPWYNDYYSKLEVKKINDYCVSVKYLESDKLEKIILIGQTDFKPRPKHFFNGELKKDWYIEYNWKIEPTNGAYIVKESECVQGEMIVVEKVADWWGHSYPHLKNQANIQKIEYKVITGGLDIIENYFWNGEIDMLNMNFPHVWRRGATNDNVTKGYVDRWVCNYLPTSSMSGMFFNTKYPLFSNKKVRQAMYYAIDIQGMIDQALYGDYKRMHNMCNGQVAYGTDFNDHTIRKPDFNPETARKMFAEAGYSQVGSDGILKNAKGERLSFELLYGFAGHTERLSVLKEQAKKAGVEIELKLMESGAFNAFINKKHQAYWGGYAPRTWPSPWQFFGKANADKVSTNNTFGWWSPEMEKLLDVDRSGPTLAEKAENNRKIEQIVHDEALIVPGTYIDFYRCGTWKWVKLPWWGNRKFNITDDYFKYDGYMWIDEDIRQEVLKAKSEGKTFEPRVWTPSTRYIAD